MVIKSGKKSSSIAQFRASLESRIAKGGLKRADFANSFGLNYATLTSVLNGTRAASIAFMEEMANKFEISLLEMLTEGQAILEGRSPPAVQSPAPAAISPERELELLRRIEAMTVKWEGLSDEMLVKDARIKEKDKVIDGKNQLIKQLSEANGKLIDILKEVGEEDRVPPDLIVSALMSLAESRNSER